MNEKLRKELEKVEDIYENIIENIHGAAEEILGNQKRKRSSTLWWIDEIDQLVKKNYIFEIIEFKIKTTNEITLGKENKIRRTVNAKKNKM